MDEASRPRNRWPGRALTVGVCLLAGLLFAVSAHEARGTDLRPGERGDLAALVREEQARFSEANARVGDLRELVEAETGNLRSAQPSETDVATSEALARHVGLDPVRGPAVTVVLDDAPPEAQVNLDPELSNDALVVHQEDVQAVVNALWAGGAEAMQVMDQRIISTSAVLCVGNVLLLQGRAYPPPYRITAIGPVDRMVQSLDTDETLDLYRQYVDLVGLTYDVTEHAQVTLPAFDGSLGLSRATVVR